MSSDKPNFLSQPVVKNIFMFRNGDPHYEARRIVINQKRVCNFETLLREVTGGIQAPFGAVRNIYTPRGGHRVESLEGFQSGEQYVAAGRERFKRMDYFQIGSRKKRMMQTLPFQAKPLPQHRINVSARFLKPIKEPCPIFVVANGDVLNPAMRLLIHQRMLGQFDRILEMITEKLGLRVLGGVRSLFTYEGQQVTDGNQLESGQLYVAAGRERFKRLQYNDLLFAKPRGARRVNGMKAYYLPPIYRFSKQNGNSKSMVRCSDSGDGGDGGDGGGDFKASPPSNGGSREHLSSIVREISQARLISLRKKRSGQSVTLSPSDCHDDLNGNTGDKSPAEQPAVEKPASADAKASEEDGEKADEKDEPAEKEEDASASKDEKKESEEEEEEESAATEESQAADEKDGEAIGEKEEEEVKEEVKEEEVKEVEEEEVKEEVKEEEVKEVEEEEVKEEEVKEVEEEEVKQEVEEEVKEVEEVKKEVKEEEVKEKVKEGEVKEEEKEEVKPEEKEEEASSSSSKEIQNQKENEKEERNPPSEAEKKEQTVEEEEAEGSTTDSKDAANDGDTGEDQTQREKNHDPEKTRTDNETYKSDGNSNQEESGSKRGGEEGGAGGQGGVAGQAGGQVSGDDDGDDEESEEETEEKDSAKDATTEEKKEGRREETEKKKN